MPPIQSIDPRTHRSFGPSFAEADADEVDRTLRRARQVFRGTTDLPPSDLSTALGRIADCMDEEAVTLADVANSETALGTDRLRGEVARTTGQLRAFAGLVAGGGQFDRVISRLPDGAPARDLRRSNLPVGIVAVFEASNFPFAFGALGGDTASALASGCGVVVKAHPGHPQTSQAVVDIARSALVETGVPADMLQLLHGGIETGVTLARHEVVAAIGFTGSTTAGRALADLAAQRSRPVPVYAEQGSVNPVVLAPSSLDRSVEVAARLADSVVLGAGQFCTKPGLIFVPVDYADAFESALTQTLLQHGPFHLLTPQIRDRFLSGIEAANGSSGVRIWRGPTTDDAYAVPAAVLSADVAALRAHPSLQDELFGPACVVVRVAELDELEVVLGGLPGTLTATIHGDSKDPWVTVALACLRTRAGRLVYGGVPTGVAVDPAMHHGGPYPASSDALHTSVGTSAVRRFLRPVSYQDFPAELLPAELKDDAGTAGERTGPSAACS